MKPDGREPAAPGITQRFPCLFGRLSALGLFLLASGLMTAAGSPGRSPERIPPLHAGPATETRDLGEWDDAFACPGQEILVLRRGEDLFALGMSGPRGKLKKLKSYPGLRSTRIVDGAGFGGRLWLFLQSAEAVPFAFEVYGGTVSSFRVPGLETPVRRAPEIQSHVALPQAGSVLLMLSGGEPGWPRDGNRPVYCWMSLDSGRIVTFPVGWDLFGFSPDQRTALFEKPQEGVWEKRPLQAVDLRTGDPAAGRPSRQDQGHVPFDWTDRQTVKPVYLRRAETGDRDLLAGISVKGSVFPFDTGPDGTRYLSTAKEKDGFAGFRLRREGAGHGEPSPFQLLELQSGRSPRFVSDGVTDFALLEAGNCVFVTAGHGRRGESSEAFFRSAREETSWNVLEGVERLPGLADEFADQDSIEDKMGVRLIEGFGHRGSLILCVFSHFRGDMRALAYPPEKKILEPTTWRRSVFVGSQGQRCLTELFQEGDLPDLIWLQSRGRIIMATYRWTSPGSPFERKVLLAEVSLRIPW